MAYITPKTDWEATDPITPTDYNRIKNNLVYINDLFNHMYDNPYTFNPGADIGEKEFFKASKFNMFEDCVEHLQRSGRIYTFGERSYYYDNGHLPNYTQLNRLEKCIEAYANTDIAVEGVTISPKKYIDTIRYSLLPGANRMTFSKILSPANASNQNVTWSTSDANVATIDSDGKVTAIGGGSTTITVTTEDGGFTDTATYYQIIDAESLSVSTLPKIEAIDRSEQDVPIADRVYIEDYLQYNSHANYVRIECESSDSYYVSFGVYNGKHYFICRREVDDTTDITKQITVKLYQDPDGSITTPSYTTNVNIVITRKIDSIEIFREGSSSASHILINSSTNSNVYTFIEPYDAVRKSTDFTWGVEDPTLVQIVSTGWDTSDNTPKCVLRGRGIVDSTRIYVKHNPTNTYYYNIVDVIS